MGRFSRSLALTKQSWSILRANPQLGLFPIVSTIVSIIVMASFAVPAYFMFSTLKDPNQMGPAHYALMFCFYLVSYFVVIFFNTGLVTCAYEIFAGRPTTFADGFRNALRHIGSIFVYALIAATVGMILRMISERAGVIGSIIARILGMAWTVVTYFVPPILVIENKNPITAIKESGSMLRQTWGENLIFNGALHMVFALIGFIAIIPMVLGIALAFSDMVVLGVLLAGCALLFLIVVCLISSTLTGVFQTALYLYARTGTVPAAYDPAWVQEAFTQKQRGFGRRRDF